MEMLQRRRWWEMTRVHQFGEIYEIAAVRNPGVAEQSQVTPQATPHPANSNSATILPPEPGHSRKNSQYYLIQGSWHASILA
jgi:hypothetical protein